MGSVSASQNGKEIYQKSVGYQFLSEKKKIKNSIASKYRIGSVTKTFTAVMIFQLIDEGKITLEQSITEYFPSIINGSEIKISNLLNHSSGLFNVPRDETFDETIPTTQEEMMARFKNRELDFQPGEKNEYSNTNYILLGYLLEKIEERSYAEILEKRISAKLGLKNTYYGGLINPENNESVSYYYNENKELKKAQQADSSNPGGAGGIVSNPSDLNVFMNALFSDKLISSESFKTMTTIQNEFGSGIFSAEKNGMQLFAHNGSIDAFKSFVVYIPEYKVSVAMNFNALDYGLMPIAFNILTVLKGEDIVIPSFETFEVTEEDLIAFSGVYECEELPYDLVFETDGKTLKGAPKGSDLKQLKPTGINEFVLESLGVHLKFNKVKKSLIFTAPGESSKIFIKKQ